MRSHPYAAFAVAVVLAFTAAPVSAAAAAAAPTAGELLDRYDKSMAALRNSRMTLVKRGETAYSWKPSQWTFEEYTMDRDEGGRMRLTWRRHAPGPAPRERLAPQDAYTTTFLWDGEKYYGYDVTALSTLARLHAAGKLDRLPPRQRANQAARMVISAGARRRDEVYVMANLDPLNGVFPGDSKIVSEVVRAAGAKVRDRRERVGGVMCYVVEAKAPSGRYTLWIDPEHGYHIAAAECRRSGDDLYDGKPLSERRIGPAIYKFDPALPRGRQVEHRFSLGGVEFRDVGGHWVPVRAEYSESEKWEDDEKRVVRKGTVERPTVELDVNFDAAGTFTPGFPDGTPVSLVDGDSFVARSGDLVWRRGRAVREPLDAPQGPRR